MAMRIVPVASFAAHVSSGTEVTSTSTFSCHEFRDTTPKLVGLTGQEYTPEDPVASFDEVVLPGGFRNTRHMAVGDAAGSVPVA